MFCDHCGQLLKRVAVGTRNNGWVERWAPANWQPGNTADTSIPPVCPRRTGAYCTPETPVAA